MKESDTYKTKDSSPEHLDENEIARYADYLRHESTDLPDGLREHVEACPLCRMEIMAVADLMDTLPEPVELTISGEGEVSRTPGRSSKYSVTRFMRIAAAVAALVAVAWGIRQFLPGDEAEVKVALDSRADTLLPATKTDSLTKGPDPLVKQPVAVVRVHDTIRYAEAFVPNRTYETLIEARFRTGANPKVVGPDPSARFHPGDSLKLTWTPDPEEEYEVIIINNKERRVAGFKAGTSGHAVWKISLAPGLYYWKFLGREDMWKVGRIKVISE
jgi:hypothetical protein